MAEQLTKPERVAFVQFLSEIPQENVGLIYRSFLVLTLHTNKTLKLNKYHILPQRENGQKTNRKPLFWLRMVVPA